MQNLPGRLAGLGGPLLMGDLKIAALGALLGLSIEDLAAGVVGGEIKSIADIPAFVEHQLETAVQDAEQQFGKPLWELLIRAPAGLDAAAIEDGQAANAVKIVQRMLGFGMALPLLTARLEAVLKGILGDHAPDGLLESIRRLPEEIGVNFFIGTVLERIFETAVATPLEEAIARQTRPARFDFRVVKAMLLKHKLTEAEAREYLANIGYREQDLTKVLDLSEQFLSVADIQALYLLGRVDLATAKDEIRKLGYSPEDTDHLAELYLAKAETQGAQQLRATARGGFLEGKITEARYRELLASVNTPERSIDLEVESANLELGWGRHQLSVANVKQLYQQGHINDRQATQQLAHIGYAEDDSAQLLATWQTEKKTTHAGLSVNRILAYELGGVITRERALGLLMETGMKPSEASMLAANPGTLGGIYAHPLTPSTVLSALREGILEVEAAKAHLIALNVAPEEVDLQIAITVAKAVRGPKPKAAHKTLSGAEVLKAFKLGLVTSSWAAGELVVIGYSEADALLLVAIEDAEINKAIPAGWVPLV